MGSGAWQQIVAWEGEFFRGPRKPCRLSAGRDFRDLYGMEAVVSRASVFAVADRDFWAGSPMREYSEDHSGGGS